MNTTPPILLIRANALLRRIFYRSRVVTRLVFAYWPSPARDDISFFELCSLVMRQALVRELRDGLRVAEMGTGPYAVMALWASSRWQLELVATEIEPRWADLAHRAAMRRDARLQVVCSDLLDGVEGPLDLVWFVPPFIAEETFVQEMKLAGIDDADQLGLLRLRTCGGKQGWELIERFYGEAEPRLATGGKALVVINRYQQQLSTIEALAAEVGLAREHEVTLPLLPYSVLVVRKG